MRNRRIYMFDDISHEMCENLSKSLDYLEETEGPIELVICSNGGEIEPMLALYDRIQSVDHKRNPVHTIGTGAVESAAVTILVSGTKRFATENAWVMMHEAYLSGGSGKEETEVDLDNASSIFKSMSYRMWDIIGRHTKRSVTTWKKEIRRAREIWLTPVEMIRLGVVDEIIEPTRKLKAIGNASTVTKSERPRATKARSKKTN